jgi:hypothetical protein
VNRQVEREETEHARLSEGILRWCLSEGGAPIRHALDEAASAPCALPEEQGAELLPGGISSSAITANAQRLARRDALGVLVA